MTDCFKPANIQLQIENNLNESEVRNMQISNEKINIALARREMTVTQLAEACKVSRNRIYILLNQKSITPASAGKIARALGVDVTEILED